MDKEKQPGIFFRAVHISKLNFEVFPQNAKEKGSRLSVEYKSSLREDGKRLVVCLLIDPMKDIEKPPFKMHLELIGIFEVEDGAANMDLEHFGKQNAPALMMPFAREIIASLTSRGPMEPLLLPPINVYALIKSSKDSEKQPSEPTK